MVDVDVRRFPASHAAGLRRLSSRASSTSTTTTRTAGLHSFNGLASSLVGRLRSMDVPLVRGLSESELLRIESNLNFSFPPDLRALLSLALPSSPGFPRWRSDPLPSLSLLFSLPLLSLSSINRAARRSSSGCAPRLRAPPLLIPVFTRCYIPSRPSLAGNPVFYVDEDRIFCCALDLQDFISKISATVSAGLTANSCPPSPVGCGNDGSGRAPRWIEFWSDAAASFDRRRRSSSSSSSSLSSSDLGPDPERFVEIRPVRVPGHGMGRYMEEIGMLLRNGGWGEEEVEEMVHLSEGCKLDCEEEEAVMDALVLRADRWKEELRAAGWEAGEVAEFLNLGNFYFEDALVGRRRRRRRVVKLPPEIQFKVEKLAEEFAGG